MSNDDTKTPDPFGPADYAAVKENIVRAFEEALADPIQATPGTVSTGMTPESCRMIHEALDRFERANGLNVLHFPARRQQTTSTDGDAA